MYMIVKEGDQWCVKDKDGTKTLGCHPTEEEAKAQLKAIEANKDHSKKDTDKDKSKTLDRDGGDMTKEELINALVEWSNQNFGSGNAYRTFCEKIVPMVNKYLASQKKEIEPLIKPGGLIPINDFTTSELTLEIAKKVDELIGVVNKHIREHK